MPTRYDPLQPTVAEPATRTAAGPSAAAPAPPPGGLRKVSLGGIAKKKDDTTNKYPVFPDPDGKAAELAARIAERQDQLDALKSSVDTDKAELGQTLIRPWYLTHFHNKTDVPSSVLIGYTVGDGPATQTRHVRVTVKEQYHKFADESSFRAVLGDDVAKYFRQSFELKVDGDKLPADKAGELIEKIRALFAQYDCTDALEAKECVVPVDNFKALRLTEMPLEQSLALENVGDKGLTQIAISTKSVRR